MRWTSLLLAVIFASFSYIHFSDGTAFFGFFYLAAALVAFGGFMKRASLIVASAIFVGGLGALVMMWPKIHLSEAMFYTVEGREFMVVCLVEVWMAAMVVEHLRLFGSPFDSQKDDAEEVSQDESEGTEGGENEERVSEQP